MPVYNVNDGTNFKLHYEIVENLLPEDTLFIHGNLASARWWYPLEEELKRQRKSQSGRMIVADFRGCGKSSDPVDLSEITMDRLAEDFIELLTYLKAPKVNLVGHSTGGTIAALMAAKRGVLFDKLVLLDPVGAKGVKFEPAMHQAFEAMKEDKNLTATVIGSTIHNNMPQSDFFQRVIVEDAYRAVKSIGAAVLKTLDGADFTKQFSQVQNPVLVLHGEHDVLLPQVESRALADLFVKGRFEVIEGQGHCTNVENPKKFLGLLQSFL